MARSRKPVVVEENSVVEAPVQEELVSTESIIEPTTETAAPTKPAGRVKGRPISAYVKVASEVEAALVTAVAAGYEAFFAAFDLVAKISESDPNDHLLNQLAISHLVSAKIELAIAKQNLCKAVDNSRRRADLLEIGFEVAERGIATVTFDSRTEDDDPNAVRFDDAA